MAPPVLLFGVLTCILVISYDHANTEMPMEVMSMQYSHETATEVRRIAKANLQWEPNDTQVERIILLATSQSYLAAITGVVYRDRFAHVG